MEWPSKQPILYSPTKAKPRLILFPRLSVFIILSFPKISPKFKQTSSQRATLSLTKPNSSILKICKEETERYKKKKTMMMKTKPFKGSNVFMSRKLVPPEVFDKLHGVLKDNGAQVFLCCDPSRNGADDFHVISSMDHVKIEKLVTAMGGVLQSKGSADVSFVVVKNVLATKYKSALNVLKKPIVTVQWLYQCWNEHRVVPQESYRVPPFSGLTICVTRIPAGDKYKVAQRWGHIHIVVRKWFDQSLVRKACLNEESFPVLGGCTSSKKSVSGSFPAQHSQDKFRGSSLSTTSSVVSEFNHLTVPSTGLGDPDLEATLSQNMSSMVSDAKVIFQEDVGEAPNLQHSNETKFDGCVANDSQSEDNDLYLSDCRISLVGFEASELRKLVTMVRRGGASRYVSCNDKLTHMIVGTPSEVEHVDFVDYLPFLHKALSHMLLLLPREKKELRTLAASGVIHVVKPNWLEDCDRQKKEIPVQQRHIACDLLLPKDSLHSVKGPVTGMISLNQSKSSVIPNSRTGMSSSWGKNLDDTKSNIGDYSLELSVRSSKQDLCSAVNSKNNARKNQQCKSIIQNPKNGVSSTVFKGKTFCFSLSFPEDRKDEIIDWVDQGGGNVVHDHLKRNANFIIECHGVITKSAICSQSTYVSTHWIRSCLEDGCLLDVASHILYSPLPCRIPFPGFESFRFCVSQYEEKDRQLLRNLCFTLGVKFQEIFTKRVTHLLCKFRSGPKYEAACKRGIQSVTSEWIYECVRQNRVVSLDPFFPKEVTAQDREAGLCTVSQFPTQAVQMMSVDIPSQFMSQPQNQNIQTLGVKSEGIIGGRNDGSIDEAQQSNVYRKRARCLEDDDQNRLIDSGEHLHDPILNENSNENNKSKNGEDLFAAIDDIVEQTSLRQDHTDSHSVIGLSRHLLNRTEKKDEIFSYSKDAGLYDGFSETQTESQVVGYEEDLSGRQMLIDRVRTRGSMS
ncbi:hypothetical protein COLO4_08845 [Corchorus olitorius]|uniref:BRCT domain-containing protein n=1 Tax=Corchorus olitorius TaxID=93759 RepID=A0A1R3KEB4_9ROSI|nr:hypothetical protein COLO4_08845 [Corchorus olitorius]